ncbi:MAG: DegT/DnrJ/EryC1/StrS family aminotransferase [Candidatus Omnitrophota bacterium]
MSSVRKNQSVEMKAGYMVPFGTISITDSARKLINTAVDSTFVTNGKYVRKFEERFAELFGADHAVAVSSGTDADALALAVLYDYGAKRGDEIIVPALTFIATGNAVLQAGFKPVFVDVRRETLNIDPEKIEAAVTERTRAIMPVHLMGKPADMAAILDIAGRHDLMVIEDAAEAHGAKHSGRYAGTIGDMGAFSLYAAHIVSSIEGGMVITKDARKAGILRSLRNHGMENKFDAVRIGFSAKMNELEAAVGLGNVEIFDLVLEKRRRNLLYLIERCRPFQEHFHFLQENEGEVIGPHAFSMILKEGCSFSKDEFVHFLDKQGIDSRNLFFSIPTQCESYRFLGHSRGDFPEAEYCSDHGTHIGIHQDLEIHQLDYVVDMIGQFLKEQAV